MNLLLSSSQRAGDCHCFRPRCKLQESSLCKLSCLVLFLKVWVALTRDHLPRDCCHRLMKQERGPGAGGGCTATVTDAEAVTVVMGWQ